jgi:cardiolipin synthase A/B
VDVFGGQLGELSVWLGLIIEVIAILLIPLVVLRRKEPSATVAWILVLIFLPCVGAALFLLFGRDRVRLPVQWKRDADRALRSRRPAAMAAAGESTPSSPEEARGSAHEHETALDSIAAPIHRGLFRLGAGLAGAEPTERNAVELLIDGAKTYEALGAAIDGARHHIYAEYYLIRSDATADWFRDKLVAAARRGVEVKLLVDGYGSFWLTSRYLRSLRQGGVEVAYFLPARLILFQPMNLRNHRKIVVVDGEVGFTGGINIGDEYRGERAPWRDTHVRIRGPAVARLADVFAQDWHFATRHGIPHFEPPAGPDPPADSWRGRAKGEATVAIVRSGPDLEGPSREAIHRLFFAAITLARSRVYVTTPYFIPDRSILVALQSAALRGVDVRLLFPSRSNHKVVFQAGRSFYEELLAAGVGIYEYGPGMIHAKTMVVDGAVALVGSANMDLRSFRLNFEVHAVVRDPATAAQLDACFEADLALSSRIDPAMWRRRGWSTRALEGGARLLSPLM